MRLTISAIVASAVLAAGFAQAQSRANSSSTSPSGHFVAIGCVTKQGTGTAARYLITDPRGEKATVYRLQGEVEQLERHVGHTMEAAGSLGAPAAGAQYTLKVSSLVWLASTCRTPTARTGVRP